MVYGSELPSNKLGGFWVSIALIPEGLVRSTIGCCPSKKTPLYADAIHPTSRLVGFSA
jgi:hypothetical protein